MDNAAALVAETTSVELVYRQDAERLWQSVYAFAGDADVASDAVAEAYAQLLHRGSAVRNPVAWTWRVAFRVARGLLKDRRANYLAGPLGVAAQPDRHADPDLGTALGKLPEAQRAAVVLFYFADLPVRDIANRLGSNSLAVRANLSRGRKRLRQLLGDENG
jgi:RNA polymerase sigma factor (sigma-70 family)